MHGSAAASDLIDNDVELGVAHDALASVVIESGLDVERNCHRRLRADQIGISSGVNGQGVDAGRSRTSDHCPGSVVRVSASTVILVERV